MRRWSGIAAAVLLVAVLGVVVWQILGPKEPVYHGKPLSQWLNEYNRAGALDKTESISEAIRAMGTNTLPFLLAHIRHSDSPTRRRFLNLVGKLRFLKLPFYGADPYRSTSILALHALGSQTAPLLPELLKFSEDPRTSYWGTISLLAIGTNSIPTLETACQSPNAQVRAHAALMIAMMKTMPPPWFSWGWNKAQPNGQPMFTISYAVGWEVIRGMVKMLESPDASIRHASADAIRRYTRPGTEEAKSAIPALIRALKDADLGVRQSAGEALKKLDPQAAAQEGLK